MDEAKTMPARSGPVLDAELRRATIDVLRERGWAGLTLERVAEAAGRARSTLWRQGLTRDVIVGALVGELADDFRATMYPGTDNRGDGPGTARARARQLCELLDRHLPLMLATDEAFHQATTGDSLPTTCTRSSGSFARAPRTAR